MYIRTYVHSISLPVPELLGLNVKVRPQKVNMGIRADEPLCGLLTSLPELEKQNWVTLCKQLILC